MRELPTGEWAEFGSGWATVTEEQRDHFLATVVIEIECDGVLQDVSPFLVFNEGNDFPFVARFTVLTEPGRANVAQDWMMRWTFTEDHFDGDFTVPAGTVWENPRTIVWTDRKSVV